jgi:hypothetical protein
MYTDNNWVKVTGEEKEGFIEQVDPIDGKHKASVDTTSVSWRQLSFYENIVLIRVQDDSWEKKGLIVYYLAREGQLYRLNGTSPPIHEVNEVAPIKVTEENILEYLRFFCFFVRGEEGPFLIVEDINNPYLPKAKLDEGSLKAIEGAIRPATYEGKNDEGHYMCDGIVYYSNALFIANFAIQSSGMIEMLDDDPVVADLPAKVDAPVA